MTFQSAGGVAGTAFPRRRGRAVSTERAWDESYTLNVLALAYDSGGEPRRAASLYRRAAEIDKNEDDAKNLAVGLCNLVIVLSASGSIREAESASRLALRVCREQKSQYDEGVNLHVLGSTLATRGEANQEGVALARSLVILVSNGDQQGEGYLSASLAQGHLWLGELKEALWLAERAWELAHTDRHEGDFIRAARLHGEAALSLGDLATAEERLNHALTRARAVNRVDEELPALTALAELHRQRGQYGAARQLLEQIWSSAERGPYPLFHADARNVLARIERDEGHRDAAIAAATRAYELAWCDGPPYAYNYGLTNAKQLLAELGAPEPQLPPFDESKFEPMPDVEINPKDEFWVDPDTLDSNT